MTRRNGKTRTDFLALTCLLALHDPMKLIYDDALNLDEYSSEAERTIVLLKSDPNRPIEHALKQAFREFFTHLDPNWINSSNALAVVAQSFAHHLLIKSATRRTK